MGTDTGAQAAWLLDPSRVTVPLGWVYMLGATYP